MTVGRRIWHDERIDPHEMLRLRDLLDVAGVRYETNDGLFGEQSWYTHSPDFDLDGAMCVAGFSCVLSEFSYGGRDGYLELWTAGMPEPDGWLSADNVMDRLRECGVIGGGR